MICRFSVKLKQYIYTYLCLAKLQSYLNFFPFDDLTRFIFMPAFVLNVNFRSCLCPSPFLLFKPPSLLYLSSLSSFDFLSNFRFLPDICFGSRTLFREFSSECLNNSEIYQKNIECVKDQEKIV